MKNNRNRKWSQKKSRTKNYGNNINFRYEKKKNASYRDQKLQKKKNSSINEYNVHKRNMKAKLNGKHFYTKCTSTLQLDSNSID